MMAKYLVVGLLACAALTGDALQESFEKKAEEGEVQESFQGQAACCCVKGACSSGGLFSAFTNAKEHKVKWNGMIPGVNDHQAWQFCCKPRDDGCKAKYPHRAPADKLDVSCEVVDPNGVVKEYRASDDDVNPESGQQCAEPSVRSDCICDSNSWTEGWQCSGCREKKDGLRTHWGYGCDFPCADSCGGDCDFIGDCECPAHCVRNDRSENPTNSNVCLNSRGECQACASGWFGLHCKEECPANCGWSHEGKCTRGGKCYTCLQGWYGELCDKQCPPACPDCMMKAGKVKEQHVEAGMCKEKCVSPKYWGKDCSNECPEHCDISDGSEHCDRGDGTCRACKARWWGPECDKSCANCKEGKCNMGTGKCEKGCEVGAWGPMCDNDCTGTKCHRQQCESDGDKYKCVDGCEVGYFGEDCEQPCSQFCEGGCTQKDGVCNACVSGRTGTKCKDTCHHRCNACEQFSRSANPIMAMFKSSGEADGDCTICHPTEPVALMKDDNLELYKCECIKGATFVGGIDQKCFCDEPKDASGGLDDKREAFFEIEPVKNCRFKCKSDYHGTHLLEVFDEKNQKSECIETALNRAVIMGGKELVTANCAADQFFVPPFMTSKGQCLGKGYVKYILKE